MATSYSQQSLGDDPLYSRLMSAALASADGFQSMSVAADGGMIPDVGGAICWYSAASIPVFNGAGIFSESLINGDTLQAIEAFFKPRRHPYSVVTLDRLVTGAARSLARWGYSEYDFMPVMWLEGPPYRAGAGLSGGKIAISRVQTSTELATYRWLLQQVFHLPSAEVDLIMGEKTLDAPHVRHYLGWLNGEVAGTISMVLSRSVAGIWNVGTLPIYRRQGLATEMVRLALFDAQQQGYTSSMLLASTEGLPLYARMGYTTLSTLRVFVPSR